MGSKGGGKRLVVDYYMGIHYGICHGPLDALLGIYIKERDAWPGKTKYDDDEDFQDGELVISFQQFIENLGTGNTPSNTASVAVDSAPLKIDRMDLFGGDEKEGGVRGTAHYLKGDLEQTLPEILAAKLGLTTATAPGFRGVASVWFYESADKGFLWCQNNPYLPPAWFTVFRRPLGLNLAESTVQRGEYAPDANPAHIIFECLTNTDWGMGASPTIIDVGSFEAASDTLLAEKFGLSMIWSQQATIEDFVKEVLDHIQATLFLNPRTGLLTLKLIRGDYDPATLREFNPDNCDATNRQRKAWAETINEINVTWTNPKNEQEETVTFQDLANIAMQGSTVSDTRNYYGVRNPELASELGVRDIRSASYPLFSTDIEVDRSAWDLLPGDVCKFSWPEDGLSSIVMRVGKVDYGRPGAGTVKASLLEDVFALETAEWVHPPTTGWVDPASDPEPFAYTGFFTVPFPMLVRAGLDVATTDEQYPRVVPAILAQQNDPDTYEFVLNGETVLPNGQTAFGELGSHQQTSYSETTAILAAEATTTATQTVLGIILGSVMPEIGSFLLIGDGTDDQTELAMLDNYNAGTDTWTIVRGVFDTVPKAWPVGTPIWYIPLSDVPMDLTERLAGEVVEYKLQSRTSQGLLPLEETPMETFELSARPYLPFRPANVVIGGVSGLGSLFYSTKPSTIGVTWANRNRTLEDQIARRWTDSNVTPEPGQTTTIRISKLDGTLIKEYAGLTGTSHNIPYADVDGNRFVKIAVLAVRDGLESLQYVERTVEFRLFGYGNNYGLDYGQDDG